ncbi:hypothetical protein AAG906_034531 [Vitis piasezkii]
MGGGTGSSEAPMIARRGRLGADQPMILHMLDIPPAAEGVVVITDVVEACTVDDVAVMVVGWLLLTRQIQIALILKEFAPSIPEKSISCLKV